MTTRFSPEWKRKISISVSKLWTDPAYKERMKQAHKKPFTLSSGDQHLRNRYGLTRKDYLTLKEKQNGQCAICGALTPKLDVDHNHAINLVRGLLCRRCNLFVAFLETPQLLSRALRYLSKW